MDESEWRYVGEGGKHAIFSYNPTCEPNMQWKGRLLRIQKKYLSLSESFVASSLNMSFPHQKGDENHPAEYIRNFLYPHLSPYIDIPVVIKLDWKFLRQLRRLTLSQGKVPLSRQSDWSLQGSEISNNELLSQHPLGTLIFDYRNVQVPTTMKNVSFSRKCISVEIKPKAGYLSFSPLVEPENRVKYVQSRFTLLQELHMQGHVKKGWRKLSAQIFEKSEYDPVDLFSNSKTRIRAALKSLFSCPQNNLRVSLDESILIGNDSNDGECNSLALALFEAMPVQEGQFGFHDEVECLLQDLVTCILYEEDLLQRLLQLQLLDILDADGAIRVYRQLLKLCDGSENEAERKIDSCVPSSETAGATGHALLSDSPFELPHGDCSTIKKFCHEVDLFRQMPSGLPSITEMDDSRNRASQLVDSMSAEECQYLLQNWLLSLAMNDVSLFITLRKLTDAGRPVLSDSGMQDGPGVRLSTATVITSRQTETEPGVLLFKDVKDARSIFLYRVKIIDTDRKPARKLRSRQTTEQAFRHIQTPASCKIKKQNW